ncbi:isoleucine--tRNA ligase [Patescibacteria group bacterium]
MQKEKNNNSIPDFPKREEGVLAFWEKEKIFEKTLAKTKKGRPFVFFEGPPTANGKPGIHHVLARAFKDIILRYKTMQGFYVERKAGWDTHGLPVEIEVEKRLKISGKPGIEKYGIKKFNAECKKSVWKYQKDWEEMTKRIGFWLDLDHPYITYENDYIESLWSIIKQVWDKQLLYKGHKVVPHCPRCGTALSSHEVAQGYKEVTEDSVYLKFKVVGEKKTFILSWTTTPWTLPGNVALAVGETIDYVKAKVGNDTYILAQAVADKVFDTYETVGAIKGKDLVGMKYEPLFDIKPLQSDISHKVYAADFVNTEEGTGIVHTAVMYGEDDYQLGEKVGLPKHHTVDSDGHFTKDVKKWAGKFVKDKKVEKGIVDDLKEQGLLLKTEPYTHSYPFCWRCDTPLLYYAKDSWFIKMSSLRKELIKNNKDINWVPAHIKDGRFGEWLNEVKDWAFSRERYWGTPLPIWICEKCGEKECVGSIKELKAKSSQPSVISHKLDLHQPYVDEITLRCSKCQGVMRRISEVADVWFDSGSMPFAQWHFPFENNERVEKGISFPAQYISEAIDQTRGWFYTLLAVSTLLGKGAPYKNVICLGHILDSKGQKMSKSKGNVVDPFEMIKKYGADALRWHFFTMNQPGDTKLFDEKNVQDVVKKNWMILLNVLSFWKMYAGTNSSSTSNTSGEAHILDRWIIAKLHALIQDVTAHLEAYAVTEAGRAISGFINELSTWYLRRSRSRFKQEGEDKEQALATLKLTIENVAKLLAPFAPFIAESIYQEVTGSKKESAHLADWPVADQKAIDTTLLSDMKTARQVVELGHALRKEHGLKVRQPLAQCVVTHAAPKNDITTLITEELNVKEVIFTPTKPTGKEFVSKEAGDLTVILDTTITDELRHEGMLREIVRHINSQRKKMGLTIQDRITISFSTSSDEIRELLSHYTKQIKKDTLTDSVDEEKELVGETHGKVVFASGEVHFLLNKV